jgi:hypothetical protein
MKRRYQVMSVAGVMLAVAPVAAQDPPARTGGPGGRGTPYFQADPDQLREFERALSVAIRLPATPVVREAPYSGEGVTTTTQVLLDGTRIERTSRTRVWRDRMGRVRREETAIGLGPLSPDNDAVTTITIEDPVTSQMHTLNPERQTARSSRTAAPPVRYGSNQPIGSESLGTRDIEGVKAIGWRMTRTIPAGQIGNDRPIVSTDERWESPELKVLVLSRQNDPRTGTVEYRLTNISRSEPPPDLFTIPGNYTTTPAPGLELGRGRGTGGGGRGGRSNAVDGLIPAIPEP